MQHRSASSHRVRFRRGGLVAVLSLLAAGASTFPSEGAVPPVTHPITFPVEGTVQYSDDFGAPRSGGRTHEGNDLLGTKLQHELAASDGVVTSLQVGASALAGNMLTLTGTDGWFYYYIHVNNDTPGTDDGLNPAQWRFAPGIAVGSHVVAGQFIAYLGDSGNAESTAPHLHFEVHPPTGEAVDPYPSLQASARAAAWPVRAVEGRRQGGQYVLTSEGKVHAYDGAPDFGSPAFGFSIARGLTVMPDGQGYLVLDGWGGVHPFGSAAATLTAMTSTNGVAPMPYWRGWDIARSMAISPSGRGLAILDGWGGVHVTGDAVAPSGGPYWPGWDIARSLAYTPSGLGSYVLDGWGGVHPAGDAVVAPSSAYWPGWDIARSIIVTTSSPSAPPGYAVLDGWGGVHVSGTAVAPPGTGWAANSDVRAFTRLGSGTFWIVRADGLGNPA